MKSLVTRILATLVAYASLVVFVLQFPDSGEEIAPWAWAVVSASVIAAIAAIGLDVQGYLRSRPQTFGDAQGIRDFMFGWIEGGGRVGVSSRDLSWVNDDAMKQLLTRKASAGDLQLFMPQPTTLSEALRQSGADVFYYEGPALRSRFTIIRCGRSDATVAIGNALNGKHQIVTYRASDNEPAFWLAQDLADVLGALTKRVANDA